MDLYRIQWYIITFTEHNYHWSPCWARCIQQYELILMIVNTTMPPQAYLHCFHPLFKVKVQLSLSTPQRCKWGVQVQVHAFLTLESDGGKWLASCTSCYMAEEESQYPQNRRLGGLQSQCRHCEEEKNLLTLRGFKLQACTCHITWLNITLKLSLSKPRRHVGQER